MGFMEIVIVVFLLYAAYKLDRITSYLASIDYHTRSIYHHGGGHGAYLQKMNSHGKEIL